MNSTNLVILAVYLGSLFGHGMMKQAEAPPAQTAQPAQTPPADQSTPPAQTPPADQSAQPAQTPPADQSTPPAQTPPADQSAQPAQTPPADQSAQPAQTPPADQSAQPAQTPPADQSAQPAQTPPADKSAQPAQTPPADKSAQPAQTPPADKSAQPAQTPPADKSAQPEQTPPAVRNAQAPTAMGGPTVDSYVIGPSDVLAITVWKEPTLSGTILVRPDGMISLALLGDVQASGMTPLQLADQIATKLKKYIQDPNVSVVISSDPQQGGLPARRGCKEGAGGDDARHDLAASDLQRRWTHGFCQQEEDLHPARTNRERSENPGAITRKR